MHSLLFYDLAPDYLERRGALREQHLALAWRYVREGKLILGGAVSDPVDLALLLFDGPSTEVAEEFAREDPYVREGLVKAWRVRPWTTVVGEQASTPVRVGGERETDG